MATIRWQFLGRKKPEEFVIYKFDADGDVTIQSDKTIGRFNMATGVGVLNAKGSNYKYSVHLTEAGGAVPHKFDPRLMAMVKANAPKSGDEIGGGIFWA